jgi:hypothetical protein
MDHYEINRRWQDLAIVLRGKEIADVYRPLELDTERVTPFDTPKALAERLVELAGLEHVLILEYLYAYFSVPLPESVDVSISPTIRDDVTFVRHELLVIAVSEMRHLRWVNQLLWSLKHAGLVELSYGPALQIATSVPCLPPGMLTVNGKVPTRPAALRPLSRSVLQDFIAAEAPSGTLDGQYARVVKTLALPQYRPAWRQLAAQILADGVEHFSRFREISFILRVYDQRTPPPYMKPLREASRDHKDAKTALLAYESMLTALDAAYGKGDLEDFGSIQRARQGMDALQKAASALATQDLGVPFFVLFDNLGNRIQQVRTLPSLT